MICAPCAAASRAAVSCAAIIDSVSPVHAVWNRAARTTRLIASSLLGTRGAGLECLNSRRPQGAHRVPRCNALSCSAFHDVTPGTQMITHVTVARTGREFIVSFPRRIRAATRSDSHRHTAKADALNKPLSRREKRTPLLPVTVPHQMKPRRDALDQPPLPDRLLIHTGRGGKPPSPSTSQPNRVGRTKHLTRPPPHSNTEVIRGLAQKPIRINEHISRLRADSGRKHSERVIRMRITVAHDPPTRIRRRPPQKQRAGDPDQPRRVRLVQQRPQLVKDANKPPTTSTSATSPTARETRQASRRVAPRTSNTRSTAYPRCA